METHDEEIPEPVDVDVFGSAGHVILLEVTDSLADGGFDLSLGSYGNMMIAIRGVSVEGYCNPHSVVYNHGLSDD